jgi:hypothetical protein
MIRQLRTRALQPLARVLCAWAARRFVRIVDLAACGIFATETRSGFDASAGGNFP